MRRGGASTSCTACLGQHCFDTYPWLVGRAIAGLIQGARSLLRPLTARQSILAGFVLWIACSCNRTAVGISWSNWSGLRPPLRQDRPHLVQDDNTRELSWPLMLALRTRGGPPALLRSGEEGDMPAEWLAKYVGSSCSYDKSW
jgi:hypothetical protein